ncbi:MAG: hypothetical protein LBU26_00250 [Synergistaceae bacterium]|jgi:hypothetical protein|nr:hypothetical protein [Synergistaceae bacterium]
MTGDKRKNAEPIILLGVSVWLVVICVSWSFRTYDFIAGSFRIDEVQVCEELDEGLRPIPADRNMPPDSQQVCLWFSYSKARRGDSVEIEWYLNERMIQREIMRVSEAKGVRAFYLLREDGSSLEPGFYSVNISCNGRGKWMENFTVEVSSEDLREEDSGILD